MLEANITVYPVELCTNDTFQIAGITYTVVGKYCYSSEIGLVDIYARNEMASQTKDVVISVKTSQILRVTRYYS